MRLIKALLYTIVFLLVVAVVGAYFLPDRVTMERSIVIDRPPSMVYPMLDGFARFNEWSPWAEKDPATRYTYEGPARGVGAKLAWASESSDVGVGSQTITAIDPGKRIEVRLDFGPMGTPQAHFALAPEGKGSTRLTWGFDAELPMRLDGDFHWHVFGRLMGPFMPDMLATDYDRGLGKLKALIEGMPAADIAGLVAEPRDVVAAPAYLIKGLSASVSAEDSAAVLGEAYGEINAFASANGLNLGGAPFTVITGHADGRWQFDAGIAVDRNDVAPTGRLVAESTFNGKVIDFRHVGSYDSLGDTHAKAHTWLAVNAIHETGNRIEIYESDPATTPVDQLVTWVRVPVK